MQILGTILAIYPFLKNIESISIKLWTISVEDEEVLNKVFEKFKEKFEDEFNFVD